MPISPTILIARKYAENVQAGQYTAPASTKTIVDKFTATNISAGTVVLSVNIVGSGASASPSNRVMSLRSIGPGECYQCPEVVGQMLEPGAYISTLCNTASALTLSASGREITNS